MFMTELNSLQQLPNNFPGQRFRDALRIFLQFVQYRSFAEFEHQMQFFIPFENFDQIHQIRMFQLLKNFKNHNSCNPRMRMIIARE